MLLRRSLPVPPLALAAAAVLSVAGLIAAGQSAPTPQAPPPVATPVTVLAPPTTTLVLNTKSDAAKAAFDAGYAATLELDGARAAAEFNRAYGLDPNLQIARAYELTIHGTGPQVGDEIEKLRVRNGSPTLIEGLLLLSLREQAYNRAGAANSLLNAAYRIAPADNRLLTAYHRVLVRGNATRITMARTLRDREPISYVAQGWLAIALTAPGDRAEATTAMNEALRLGPDRPFTHWVAGEVMTLRREYDAAIGQYAQALQLKPDYYQALVDRATTNLYARRPADARKDFQLWQQRSLYNIDLAAGRRAEALTYFHEGNTDEAIRQMTRVCEKFEAEGTWHQQLALAHQHLAVLAAVKKDVAGVEQHLAAEQKLYLADDPGLVRFWGAIALSLAGSPARAREELTAYQKLADAGQFRPTAADIAAINAMVLVVERKFDEAVQAAGTNTAQFAAIAGYQALKALGKTQEASQRLQPVLDASGYAADNMAVPIARILAGQK